MTVAGWTRGVFLFLLSLLFSYYFIVIASSCLRHSADHFLLVIFLNISSDFYFQVAFVSFCRSYSLAPVPGGVASVSSGPTVSMETCLPPTIVRSGIGGYPSFSVCRHRCQSIFKFCYWPFSLSFLCSAYSVRR